MYLAAPQHRLVLFLTISALLFASCTHPTQVAVGGGGRPVFTVKGSAKLTSFKVLGPKAGDPEGKPTELIWQLEPAGGTASVSLDSLGQIQYGVIPTGFVQRVPATGGPAPPAESTNYQAEIGTTNGPLLNLRFAVRNGQTVNVGAASNLHNIPTH